MKKILALRNGIEKVKNVAKFVKVLISTIEYFGQQMDEIFPKENEDEPLKPAENEVLS